MFGTENIRRVLECVKCGEEIGFYGIEKGDKCPNCKGVLFRVKLRVKGDCNV